MSYQVLARKWRPQTFADMVGQEHVTATLANALVQERVAHAYLFTGPRGCGKTTMARLMAKALNCDEGTRADPCGKCNSCVSIAAGTFLDVLEIDAASNTGVDNIRELRENAQYQPQAGKKRVFIIDEVHMLSKGAFNALLKTLEEPPPHVYFIFATTEPVRVPRTILSRCQRFDFRLFRLDELVSRITTIAAEESMAITSEAIELLASMAEGSMRDALSLFDQAVSSCDGQLDKDSLTRLFGLVGHERYLQLNDAIVRKDTRAVLDLVDELANAGHDLVEFARGLVGNFRDLMLLRLDDALASRVEKPEAVRAAMLSQAAQFEIQDLMYLTQRAATNYLELERVPQPRWLLEAQMVDYARHESQVLLSDVLGRLQALSPGGGTASTPTAGPGGKKVSTAKPIVRAEGATKARAAARVDEPGAQEAISRTGFGDDLREPYARFLARAREERMGVGTCLLEAVPRVVDGQLRLVFRPEHAFHRDQVAARDVVDWLGRLATDCFGRPLPVVPLIEDIASAEEEVRKQVQAEVAPTQKQELDRRTAANPALGRLLEGLGGEIVDE